MAEQLVNNPQNALVFFDGVGTELTIPSLSETLAFLDRSDIPGHPSGPKKREGLREWWLDQEAPRMQKVAEKLGIGAARLVAIVPSYAQSNSSLVRNIHVPDELDGMYVAPATRHEDGVASWITNLSMPPVHPSDTFNEYTGAVIIPSHRRETIIFNQGGFTSKDFEMDARWSSEQAQELDANTAVTVLNARGVISASSKTRSSAEC